MVLTSTKRVGGSDAAQVTIIQRVRPSTITSGERARPRSASIATAIEYGRLATAAVVMFGIGAQSTAGLGWQPRSCSSPMFVRMLGTDTARADAALALGAGANARGRSVSPSGERTSAANNITAPPAVASDTTMTWRRRGGSDVAPSRSSITSAQPVRELRELRHGERARRHLEDGVILDPADRARAVDRERRLRRAAAYPQRRIHHQRRRIRQHFAERQRRDGYEIAGRAQAIGRGDSVVPHQTRLPQRGDAERLDRVVARQHQGPVRYRLGVEGGPSHRRERRRREGEDRRLAGT